MNELVIQSHRGPYVVHFGPTFAGLEQGLQPNEHLLIDARVADLYAPILAKALSGHSVLRLEAAEANKSLEKIPVYLQHLLQQGIKRGHRLVAVGGGILQDIAAFIAAILFRGLAWRFYPTTLLAQADSCIGSKSSINVAGFKNQVGTFTPPESIHIATEVLETLTDADFRSGLGEIIKVHLIAGWENFRWVEKNYARLGKEKTILIEAIRRSLAIKKELVEKDEFDLKERLVLNYGHSFGHAIESATCYRIPHGIAVTMGMAMANFVSKALGLMAEDTCQTIYPLLKRNYACFERVSIPLPGFFEALAKDKKNTREEITLILSRGPGKVFKERVSNDDRFQSLCRESFKAILV